MKVRLALLGAVALSLGHYAVLCRQVPLVDDYWIFLRYADNALGGHAVSPNLVRVTKRRSLKWRRCRTSRVYTISEAFVPTTAAI